jgi:hypothetical protein
MNILCITDQSPDSEHSAIEGIFNGALRKFASVSVVYFCRKTKKMAVNGPRIILPHRYKRANLIKPLQRLLDVSSLNVIIVRNYFPVLKRILAHQKRYAYRVGFWESFPHSFRSIFQAKVENRSIFRKSIEYKISQLREKRLLTLCDFYLPITETYRRQFHPDLSIPYHPLPMGVDFSRLPRPTGRKGNVNTGARKFVYVGAIDQLRKLDVIVSAFTEYDADFEFGIYTASQNQQVGRIESVCDSRIRVHHPLPRAKLLAEMLRYDIGIGLIPDNDLYHVSSSTKTLEYYALGIPAIINRLPEYTSLFDQDSAFFCDLNKESIKSCIAGIFHLSLRDIIKKGRTGYRIVRRKRDYEKMSSQLLKFLRQQLE